VSKDGGDSLPEPPAASLTITNSGLKFVLGYGPDFFGVWDREKQGPPVARFPRTDDGRQGAWLHFSTLENGPTQPKRKTSPGTRVVALVLGLVLLLSALAFFNPRVNIPVVSEFVCSVKGGTWSDGSVSWGYGAGCYDVPTP
jgi:hypothetical protein